MAYVKTVEVEGEAGRIVVNLSDVDSYVERGYKIIEGTETSGKGPKNDGNGNVPVDAPADADDAQAVTRDDVDKMKSADLEKLVADNNLDVDLSELKKIGDKRDAVADALGL